MIKVSGLEYRVEIIGKVFYHFIYLSSFFRILKRNGFNAKGSNSVKNDFILPLNLSLLQKERSCSLGSKFLAFRIDPFS